MSAQSPQADLSEQQDPGKSSPSGRLLLRMPRTLHAELARAAEREGVSLNQFITSALSSTVGWRSDEERVAPAGAPGGTEPRAPRAQTPMIAVALIANVVVVGLTAVAAIAILLLAWLG